MRPASPTRVHAAVPGIYVGSLNGIGAAAVILGELFGADREFTDRSQVRLGFAPRTYPSFWAAAEEAAVSRLYGGIHFRSGNEEGLMQGRCVGEHVLELDLGGP